MHWVLKKIKIDLNFKCEQCDMSKNEFLDAIGLESTDKLKPKFLLYIITQKNLIMHELQDKICILNKKIDLICQINALLSTTAAAKIIRVGQEISNDKNRTSCNSNSVDIEKPCSTKQSYGNSLGVPQKRQHYKFQNKDVATINLEQDTLNKCHEISNFASTVITINSATEINSDVKKNPTNDWKTVTNSKKTTK
ncbi:unnamed protein product [Psylliodes chrysocephalus]|uniref:Uncharacterized protein n=1 Tax=Psylliodes chrysocephalus TaxID=3402493 RepID=A0A9P0CQY8_9CUCU|nr:unnamed protein product [Psylliodes chrysocephala]